MALLLLSWLASDAAACSCDDVEEPWFFFAGLRGEQAEGVPEEMSWETGSDDEPDSGEPEEPDPLTPPVPRNAGFIIAGEDNAAALILRQDGVDIELVREPLDLDPEGSRYWRVRAAEPLEPGVIEVTDNAADDTPYLIPVLDTIDEEPPTWSGEYTARTRRDPSLFACRRSPSLVFAMRAANEPVLWWFRGAGDNRDHLALDNRLRLSGHYCGNEPGLGANLHRRYEVVPIDAAGNLGATGFVNTCGCAAVGPGGALLTLPALALLLRRRRS